MRYNYPSVSHQGKQLKALITAYSEANSKSKSPQLAPTLLLHSLEAGAEVLDRLGTGGPPKSKTG